MKNALPRLASNDFFGGVEQRRVWSLGISGADTPLHLNLASAVAGPQGDMARILETVSLVEPASAMVAIDDAQADQARASLLRPCQHRLDQRRACS
jgi:hypothetical protein